MPTSYSTLLGLALPVTGELSGTWGDEVNNYITQYLDAAVAGVQTISGSQTAVTLSRTTNASLSQAGSGATGSSQYQIINCTGNPATALTVTVPSTSKVYVVLNNTSTNQTVTVKGAATTGVTVAAARSALIAWNGTDFELVATDDASKMNGVLAAANGGTGQSSYTTGDILYASSSTALAKLADVATGNALISGGVGVAPSYGKIGLTTHVSGTLPVANGGTGITSGTSGGVLGFTASGTIASSAALTANALVIGGGAGATPTTTTTGTGVLTALGTAVGSAGAFVVNGGALGTPSSGTLTNATGLPLTTGVTGTLPVANGGTNATATPTAGAVAYGTGTAYAFTSAGTAGQVLQSNGAGAPTWANASTGTVTSVSGTGTVQGLTLSGSVTSSGSLTLGGSLSAVSLTTQVSGTLPVANGGTGATTLTANNVLLGNGTSALQVVAPGSSGNVLTSNGTTWTSAAPAATGGTTKTWTSFTSTGTYTVPTGVTSIRVYAFGAGGNCQSEYSSPDNWTYSASGAGGGCAFGDLAVTAGQTVTITISGGNATVSYASVTRFTANKGANATTPYSAPNVAAGGTASIGTGVTNGNAYTGGDGSSGGIFGSTGGSSASPLGNGTAARGSSSGGGGWGTGNGGDASGGTSITGSGGAGGAPGSNGQGGAGRGGYLLYTDPLLESLTSPGVTGFFDNSGNLFGATGGPGAGGGGVSNARNGSYTLVAGSGGFGGGGGGGYNGGPSANTITTGAGGFGASGGSARNNSTSGSVTVGASGFGAGASCANSYGIFGSTNGSVAFGTAGAAIVLIYA